MLFLPVDILTVRGILDSCNCLLLFSCFLASTNPNFLFKLHVFSRVLRASGRNLKSWHSTVCCRKYLTLDKTVNLSDLSWLSYKLLFVRQDPSSITLGGKPSLGRSCHLEADLFSRLTDSAPSPCVCLSLSISPIYCPSPRCLCRSNHSCKHLWFSINFRNSTFHCFLPVCHFSEPCLGDHVWKKNSRTTVTSTSVIY